MFKRLGGLMWALILGAVILAIILGFYLAFRVSTPEDPIVNIIKLIQYLTGPLI